MFDVLAASPTIAVRPKGDFSPLANITVGSIVSGAIQLILIVAALIFFFLLIIGGIRWMTAGGDKEKAGAARSQLTSALVGLAIVFAAWAVVQLIDALFNVNIMGGFTLPSLNPNPAP